VRPFRFGIQLRNAAGPEAWIAKAKHAEDLGYSVVSIMDHTSDQLAPMPAIAALAVATTRVRLGTMVLANDWRNPVLLAREAATIDWLSGGRFELGVGAGWQVTDYERLGIAYDEPDVRIARLEEALAITKSLFTGSAVDYAGRHYTVKGATIAPAPVQPGGPPIVIGGGSRKMMELAGRFADVVNIHTNLGAGQRGEDARPSIVLSALERRLRWLRDGAGKRYEAIELGLRILVNSVTGSAREAAKAGARFGLDPDATLASPYALIGTVDEIVRAIESRRERWGFSSFVWNEPELDAMAPVVERLVGR